MVKRYTLEEAKRYFTIEKSLEVMKEDVHRLNCTHIKIYYTDYKGVHTLLSWDVEDVSADHEYRVRKELREYLVREIANLEVAQKNLGIEA